MSPMPGVAGRIDDYHQPRAPVTGNISFGKTFEKKTLYVVWPCNEKAINSDSKILFFFS